MNKKHITFGIAGLALTLVAGPALAGNPEHMSDAYKKVHDNYINAHVGLKDAKADVREVRTEENGKARLQQVIERMIKKLDQAEIWVQNRQGVSESDKNQALAQIEKELTWLKDKQIKVATMTHEELKATAKKIREHIELSHKKIKRMLGHVIEKRVEHSVEKINGIVSKVENKLTELKLAGKNLATYETRLADVKAKVATAQLKYTEAKNIYASIESKDNATELFKSARTAVEEGNKLLRTAAGLLTSLIQDVRIEFGAKVTTTSTAPSA